jgi:hypothetical protein
VTKARVSVEYRTTVRRFDQARDQAEQREQRYKRAQRNDDVEGTLDYSANRLLSHSSVFPGKKPAFGLHQLSCMSDNAMKRAEAVPRSALDDRRSEAGVSCAEVGLSSRHYARSHHLA